MEYSSACESSINIMMCLQSNYKRNIRNVVCCNEQIRRSMYIQIQTPEAMMVYLFQRCSLFDKDSCNDRNKNTTELAFISPLRSIPADGFIAWRNFLSVFPFVKLANKSGVATLSVTKNCSMGALYLTWQGCFRRFLISGAELLKYDFFLQNIAILNTFSSSVNW